MCKPAQVSRRHSFPWMRLSCMLMWDLRGMQSSKVLIGLRMWSKPQVMLPRTCMLTRLCKGSQPMHDVQKENRHTG